MHIIIFSIIFFIYIKIDYMFLNSLWKSIKIYDLIVKCVNIRNDYDKNVRFCIFIGKAKKKFLCCYINNQK